MLGLFGNQTPAKINVTPQSALGLSAFWQGVRVISETIAYLPVGLYREADNGNMTRQKRHFADRIINHPSSLVTSYKFRETMQAIATIRGNSYAFIERDGNQRPTALHILNPTYVEPFFSGGDLYYKVYDWPQPVHHLNMLHIKGMSILRTVLNDWKNLGHIGENPLFLGKDSLSVGLAAQQTEGSILGNGSQVGGFLTMPGKIDPSDKRAVEDSWQRRYSGSDNAGKTPLLGGGMDYKRIALTPQESMLMETRKFSVEEVARLLNIPQHKLGHLDKASFNNIEQLARDFYIQTVRPWTENWESEMELKLLTETEKQRGDMKFRFDFFDLLRADTKVLGELIRSLFNVGIISINDGRRLMQMNVVDEDWADKHWVPLNVSEPDNRPEPKHQGQPANTNNTKNESNEEE